MKRHKNAHALHSFAIPEDARSRTPRQLKPLQEAVTIALGSIAKAHREGREKACLRTEVWGGRALLANLPART